MTTPGAKQAARAGRGSLLLDTLNDERFSVVEPFEVTWYEEGDSVVAVCSDTEDAGCGGSLSEAVVDLQEAMVEVYLALDEQRDNLAPHMRRIYDAFGRNVG